MDYSVFLLPYDPDFAENLVCSRSSTRDLINNTSVFSLFIVDLVKKGILNQCVYSLYTAYPFFPPIRSHGRDRKGDGFSDFPLGKSQRNFPTSMHRSTQI